MKVLITWTDGIYHVTKEDGPYSVEVPDHIVELWSAVGHMFLAAQKQIKYYDEISADPVRPRR